jgi:hypothetical protein
MNTPESRPEDLSEKARISHTAMEILSVLHTGKTMDEIFDAIFDELKKIIPYDRIGLSLLEEGGKRIVEHKVKSDSKIQLTTGYSCQFDYTTLGEIFSQTGETKGKFCVTVGGKRRIIFDLPEYVNESGRVTPYNKQLMEEGIRSSLTIPLYIGGKPAAFLFFSSREPNVYTKDCLCGSYDLCMDLLDAIQPHLALAVDKGITISQLQETNRRLNELLAMKDDFLSIASHDLRSPLSTILGYSRLILTKTEVTEPQRKMVGAISNSAGHLLLLVEDMLALAKANAGAMELNLKNARMGDILGQSLTAMSFNAHNKNIEIVHDQAECPESLLDGSKMFQVFNNLLSNAIKFSPAGSVIKIKESINDGQYSFAVSDGGPGISEEDQKSLFQKFSQVGSDSGAKQMGSGLGLMICKMIVEKHGGQIRVESLPGKGSAFSFTVPLRANG